MSCYQMRMLLPCFENDELSDEERFRVMCMMFGSQRDPYDFHYVGIWDGYLADLLMEVGFREIYRVERFGMFHDDSETRYDGELISLNIVAVK